MGSENLHHKRKAKDAKNLQRRKSQRASYEKILIVCEGEKTEPNYFNELVRYYKLNTANVEIDGSCGSSPKSVLKKAEELGKKEAKKGEGYDRIYCVFDKDTHQSYDETINKIRSKKYMKIYYAAESVPCFEYWLLLHFKCSTKPYHATSKSSIANQVLKELKKYLPNYAKGDDDLFITLIEKIEVAKTNAIKSLEEAEKARNDNPSTYIHKLVDYLQKIKGS